jgi:hypothetical protein
MRGTFIAHRARFEHLFAGGRGTLTAMQLICVTQGGILNSLDSKYTKGFLIGR